MAHGAGFPRSSSATKLGSATVMRNALVSLKVAIPFLLVGPPPFTQHFKNPGVPMPNTKEGFMLVLEN